MEESKHTASFQVDQEIVDRVNELIGFARDNGVKCSDGLLIRAAIMGLVPQTPETLGIIRARKEYESSRRKEKRSSRSKKSRAGAGR